jgi:protein SCO1
MRRINPFLAGFVLFIAGAAAGVIWKYFPVSPDTPGTQTSGKALIGGPFSLVDTDGKRVTDRDFRGKFMLVFFGYAHCPDVCPSELQTMAEVVDKLGPAADAVAPVFISVDPGRDTPEALAAYVKAFSPRITGLTGTLDETASAAKAYRVYFRKAAGGPDDYSVDHSAFVYLMDREGNYLTHFTFNTTADAIAAVIKKHLSSDRSA